MSWIKLPKTWPVTIGSVTKRQITIIQKNEFKVCQPVTREKTEWFGFKKRILLVHLKEDGRWNIKQV